MYNPDVVTTLQRAARSGDPRAWQQYCDAVHARPPSALRDLLELVPAAAPVPLDEVAPASTLFPRFDTAAISLGALSPEAHEALAIAMNRLGGRSNSGEGGEDPALWHREAQQDQAGRLGPLRRYRRVPGQCRSAADQGRAGRQARRGPAARPQGQRTDRTSALRAAGHRPDLAAAAPTSIRSKTWRS